MCKHGDMVVLQLDNLKSNFRPEGKISVDRCIAPLIKSLNENGYDTVACCCGHGNRPTSIILKDDRRIIMLPDYETGHYVDHLFPYCIDGSESTWKLPPRERIRLLFTGRIFSKKRKSKWRARYFKMLKKTDKDKERERLRNNLFAIRCGGVMEAPVGNDEDLPKKDD